MVIMMGALNTADKYSSLLRCMVTCTLRIQSTPTNVSSLAGAAEGLHELTHTSFKEEATSQMTSH